MQKRNYKVKEEIKVNDMIDRHTTITEIEKNKIFVVGTEVTLEELIYSTGDEFLWNIASQAVTLHIGRMVVVNQPEYRPIKVMQGGQIRLRIDCYLKGDDE